MPGAPVDLNDFTQLALNSAWITAIKEIVMGSHNAFNRRQARQHQKVIARYLQQSERLTPPARVAYIELNEALAYLLSDIFRLLNKVVTPICTDTFEGLFIGAFLVAMKHIYDGESVNVELRILQDYFQRAFATSIEIATLIGYEQALLNAIEYAIPRTPAANIDVFEGSPSLDVTQAKQSTIVFPPSPTTTIHVAVQQNDLVRVKAFIQNDPASINALDDFQQTPLIWAASLGLAPMVSYLLTQNPDLTRATNANGYSQHGMRAVDWALLHGHHAICRQLLAAGARRSLTKEAFLGYRLNHAARRGDLKQLQKILSLQPSLVNYRDQDKTPLQWAIITCRATCVKALVELYHADIHATCQVGGDTYTTLDLVFKGSISSSSLSVIRYFMSAAQYLMNKGAITQRIHTLFCQQTLHQLVSYQALDALQLLLTNNPTLIYRSPMKMRV